jgi:hypothetical protein
MLIKILVKVQIFCKFLLNCRLLLLFFTYAHALLLHGEPQAINVRHIDGKTYQIIVPFTCTPPDFVYYEYLTISIDCPEITLLHWRTSQEPTTQYDITFKQSKQMLKKSFFIEIFIRTSADTLPSAYLHITYFQHSHKKIEHALFALENSHGVEQAPPPPTIREVKRKNDTLSKQNFSTNTLPPYLVYLTTHAVTLYAFFIFLLAVMYGILIWLCIRTKMQNPQRQFFIIAMGYVPFIVLIYYPIHITYFTVATVTCICSIMHLHSLSQCSQHTFKRRFLILLTTILCMVTLAFSCVLYAHAWKISSIKKAKTLKSSP